jgi:hypothetical protein
LDFNTGLDGLRHPVKRVTQIWKAAGLRRRPRHPSQVSILIQLLDGKGREILYPVEDDRDRWWARKLEGAVNHHRDLAERDLDGLQSFSLDVVRRVQQKMEKEKC